MRNQRRVRRGGLAAAVCLLTGGCYSSSGRAGSDAPDSAADAGPGDGATDATDAEPEVAPSCPDDDGDGFRDSACGGTDCDDTSADVYPGAPETCRDGIDSDCDGLIDGPMLMGEHLVVHAVAPASEVVEAPSLLWTGTEFVVAWPQRTSGRWDVRLARIPSSGDRVEREVPVAEDAGPGNGISLVWTGSGVALTWADSSGEEYPEIYFALVDARGDPLSGVLRVTDDPWLSAVPDVVWTGTEFAIAWIDTRLTESSCTMMGCSYDIYLARLDPHGTKLGDDIRVSDRAASPGGNWAPVFVAWTGTDLGVFWSSFARLRPDGSALAPDLDGAEVGRFPQLP